MAAGTPASRKRLLFIAYTMYGSDPRAIRLCEGAAREGYAVEAFCLAEPGRPRTENRNGVDLVRSRVPKYQGGSTARYLVSYGSFFVGAFLTCVARIWRRRPNVVLVKNMPNALVFAALPLKLAGVGVVLDIRDSMPEVYESKFGRTRLWRLLVAEEVGSTRFADHVICAHEPHRQLCIEHGADGAKITPIMNLPDEEQWRRCGEPDPATFTVLYHGLLAPRTGVDLLLRACAAARRPGDNLRLRIVGAGDQYPELKRLATDLGLDDILDMTGKATPSHLMPQVVSQANLLVVPQRGDAVGRIGLPRKLLEAALLEVPAIVSRSPAIEHYFSDEMVHYVPPEDVDALAASIREFTDRPELGREMAARAAEFSSIHTWARERSRLGGVLDGAASRTLEMARDEGSEA